MRFRTDAQKEAEQPVLGTFPGTPAKEAQGLYGAPEYYLEANWSLKAEGLYYDLGSSTDSASITLHNTIGTFLSTTTIYKKQDNDGYVGRVGLNHHF